MLPHKSSSLPLLPERAWGNVSRRWVILVVGLGAACSWTRWKSLMSSPVCVCIRDRLHMSAEQCMQACIMSGACFAQAWGNACSHKSWGCRQLAAVCAFGLLWDCGWLLDKDKTKEKRHYIILKRVHSPWASLGMQTLFSHTGPILGQGQDTACWVIANVLLAQILLEANYVRDFPAHFNFKSYVCPFVLVWEPTTKRRSAMVLSPAIMAQGCVAVLKTLLPCWQLTLSGLCAYNAQHTDGFFWNRRRVQRGVLIVKAGQRANRPSAMHPHREGAEEIVHVWSDGYSVGLGRRVFHFSIIPFLIICVCTHIHNFWILKMSNKMHAKVRTVP